MATVTNANPADFAKRVQEYFNPKLLKELLDELVLANYGMRQKFPANGQTIRFFRPRPADSAQVHGALTQGTVPTTLAEVAVGYVDVALSQRGGLAKITDLVLATDLLNTVALYTKTMAADAALDLDTVIRNALATGLNDSNATYTGAYFERFAGTTNTGVSSTDFATMNGLSTANGKITRGVHLGVITQLKASKVPTIGGKYVVVVPPEVMHDIRQDTTWVSAATNVDTQALYKRGQIMLDGAVFVEANNPWREAAVYKTYSATGANYGCFYLGEGAFGCPELSDNRAGGSPMGPKMTVLNQPDKSDPINQLTYIGWKCLYGAKPLIALDNSGAVYSWEVPRYALLRCKSTFA